MYVRQPMFLFVPDSNMRSCAARVDVIMQVYVSPLSPVFVEASRRGLSGTPTITSQVELTKATKRGRQAAPRCFGSDGDCRLIRSSSPCLRICERYGKDLVFSSRLPVVGSTARLKIGDVARKNRLILFQCQHKKGPEKEEDL